MKMEQEQNKGHRPLKIARVKCTRDSFFKVWVVFMRPYHRLAPREGDVFATIIAQYFKLKAVCESPSILRALLWSSTSRTDMRKALGMSQPHFQLILKKLRDCGALIGQDINPRYLPHISPDSNSFELRVIFDYSTPDKKEMPSIEIIENR